MPCRLISMADQIVAEANQCLPPQHGTMFQTERQPVAAIGNCVRLPHTRQRAGSTSRVA